MPFPARGWSALIAHVPFVPAPVRHRAGLEALHAGRRASALRCFARAARAYRRDLEVEALARLRVHEWMARLEAGAGDAEVLELERRLAHLDTIESPVPPHALVPAHVLMAMPRGDAGERTASAA